MLVMPSTELLNNVEICFRNNGFMLDTIHSEVCCPKIVDDIFLQVHYQIVSIEKHTLEDLKPCFTKLMKEVGEIGEKYDSPITMSMGFYDADNTITAGVDIRAIYRGE